MVWRQTSVKTVCLACLLINSFTLAHIAVRGNRASLKSGWTLDIIYAVECFLNILAELLLLSSLFLYDKAGAQAVEDLKSSLRIFLWWTAISVILCYGANIKLTHDFRNAERDENINKGGEAEHEFYFKMYTYILAFFTITAAIKTYVTYSIYGFYQNIVHVSSLKAVPVTIIAQAAPGLVLPTAAVGQYTVAQPQYALPSQYVQVQAVPQMAAL